MKKLTKIIAVLTSLVLFNLTIVLANPGLGGGGG
jgi:hypothetical protein